jgi:hypothetical protein
MGKTLIEHSKTPWVPPTSDDKYPGDENIKIGLMQRMASSLERIEKPYLSLINDAKSYREWYQSERQENKRLSRRIAALQGVITKLKKKSK